MRMAEGVGFEPTRRLPTYTLSRRADSAVLSHPSERANYSTAPPPKAGALCAPFGPNYFAREAASKTARFV